MFNCHGELVDLAQINNCPLASMSKAGMFNCRGEPVDFMQNDDAPFSATCKAEQSQVAEESASEGEREPWWYRLLVPSDSGTVATLGLYAPADFASESAAADDAGEQVSASQAQQKVADANSKIITKFNLECATVVGKSILDWEPEPEVAAAVAAA